MNIPPDLELDDEAEPELRRQADAINVFLAYARTEMLRMNGEVDRLGRVRGNIFIHNAPGGLVIGVPDSGDDAGTKN